MREDILQRYTCFNQASKDGRDMVINKEFENFLHDLIREDKFVEDDGTYSLNVHDLTSVDIRQFLYFILDRWDYEWYTEKPEHLELGFRENKKHMQRIIDSVIDDVLFEDMRAADVSYYTCPVTGSALIIR